jgi:multidrug efflux pump subunit AcrA (membrane-fusion protein)
VFTVLDPETVWVEAQIPELNLPRLGRSKSARIELPGQPGQPENVGNGEPGRFLSLGLEVDVVTRTAPLIYEWKNPDGLLRVGQSLNLHVETDRAENTLAIPHDAVVEEGGRPIAFVQVGGETFQKRDLTLGIRDGNWVQVLSGIQSGERVVTQGAYAVRLASMSSAIPSHGHAH